MDKERVDRQGAVHLAEDTTGWGLAEVRTARDLILHPRRLLEQWMTQGSTAGGHYSRPLRFYIGLNAIMMVVLFIRGGGFIEVALPPPMVADWARSAGKSTEMFLADAENWLGLVLVPVFCALYALMAVPLLRWWDAEDLGWRRGFRATFAYLSAWTVLMVPLSWFTYDIGPVGMSMSVVMFLLSLVTFLRMGRGRWYRSPGIGVIKALALSITLYLASLIGMAPVLGIAIAGAMYAG